MVFPFEGKKVVPVQFVTIYTVTCSDPDQGPSGPHLSRTVLVTTHEKSAKDLKGDDPGNRVLESSGIEIDGVTYMITTLEKVDVADAQSLQSARNILNGLEPAIKTALSQLLSNSR